MSCRLYRVLVYSNTIEPNTSVYTAVVHNARQCLTQAGGELCSDYQLS